MEYVVDKAKDYILALKEAGSFTFEDIANLSGDLNELIGYEKKKEIEVNSTVSLKETYEMRISDLIKSYETRIEDIKALCEMRIADVQKCCEIRIADMKQNFEERINEQKQMLTKGEY